jgi:hypothetical protein
MVEASTVALRDRAGPIHPDDVDVICRLFGAISELTEALKEFGEAEQG